MSRNSISGPRPKRGRQTMPSKTTLNLAMREKSELAPSRVLPAVLVIVVFAALFGKFAVADRYARLYDAERALGAQQTRLEELELSYADFDEVKEQYSQYTYEGFDRSIADRQEILGLLERDIIPYSETQSISVTGNVFSTTLIGLTLDQVSSMIARLEADPLVESVTVSTAGYNEEDIVHIDGDSEAPALRPYASMTIVFTNADEDGGDTPEPEAVVEEESGAEGGAQ